ncbi:unnamed protein product [Pedinophyceae sp. YPF-701]|nr:unnamed protein product [Pedinophyceae sp. YPF-701]
MSKSKTSCKDAMKQFEELLSKLRTIQTERPEISSQDIDPLTLLESNKGLSALPEYKKVTLIGMGIEKMDNSLGQLKACEHLSLGSNSIDKIGGLTGLENLRILSLGRNKLKKLDGVDAAPDLEELWVSYNDISSLAGVEKLPNLKVLFCSNNKISSFDELERLAGTHVKDLNLLNNPLYGDMEEGARRVEVLKRLPNLTKLDGKPVELDELDAARGA